jgi:MFS family permease
MVVVDIARAVVIVGLALAVLLHSAGLALIYVTTFLRGTGSVVRDTASLACVPRLVEPDDLDKANGQMIAGQIVGSNLAGPAAGGWLFGLAAVLPFAINAGTLGIGVLLLLTLPGVFAPPARQRQPGSARPWLSSFRHDLGEGLRWVRQDPGSRDVMIMAGVVCAMDSAWFAVLVLDVIKTRRIGPWRSLLVAGLAMATTQAALGLTGSVIIAALLMMVSSAAFALFNMTVTTMRQRQVPDALLGRVSSVYFTVTMGTEALGAIVGGAIAAAGGIRAPMLLGAGPIAAVTILVTWRHRDAGRSPRPKVG